MTVIKVKNRLNILQLDITNSNKSKVKTVYKMTKTIILHMRYKPQTYKMTKTLYTWDTNLRPTDIHNQFMVPVRKVGTH